MKTNFFEGGSIDRFMGFVDVLSAFADRCNFHPAFKSLFLFHIIVPLVAIFSPCIILYAVIAILKRKFSEISFQKNNVNLILKSSVLFCLFFILSFIVLVIILGLACVVTHLVPVYIKWIIMGSILYLLFMILMWSFDKRPGFSELVNFKNWNNYNSKSDIILENKKLGNFQPEGYILGIFLAASSLPLCFFCLILFSFSLNEIFPHVFFDIPTDKITSIPVWLLHFLQVALQSLPIDITPFLPEFKYYKLIYPWGDALKIFFQIILAFYVYLVIAIMYMSHKTNAYAEYIKSQAQKSEYEFEKMYVIESLMEDKTKSAIELYKKIAVPGKPDLPVQFFTVNSKQEFYECLDLIQNDTQKGIVPSIHLEIRGDAAGLNFSNNEILTWSDFLYDISYINFFTKNQIILTLAKCPGIYILENLYGHLMKGQINSPFSAIIANMHDITNEDLDLYFYEFLENIFRIDIETALKKFNGYFEINISDKVKKLELVNSAEIFKIAYGKSLLANEKNEIIAAERIADKKRLYGITEKELINEINIEYRINIKTYEELLDFTVKEVIADAPFIFKNLKSKYFFFEDYPELKEKYKFQLKRIDVYGKPEFTD